MDKHFLLLGWLIQALAYGILLYRWRREPLRWLIFATAVLVYLLAPAVLPFKGGFDPQTGEYVCGMVGFARTMMFWIVGNFVNLWLFLISFWVLPQRC
jgi:hypothetical protein